MSVPGITGYGLQALPAGTMERVVHKSGCKFKAGQQVQERSNWAEIKRGLSQGMGNEILYQKARHTSEQRVTGRYAQLNFLEKLKEKSNGNNEALTTRIANARDKVESAISATDFQATHEEQVFQFVNKINRQQKSSRNLEAAKAKGASNQGEPPLEKPSEQKRHFLSLPRCARFNHMIADSFACISSMMRECLNAVYAPTSSLQGNNKKVKFMFGCAIACVLIAANSLFLGYMVFDVVDGSRAGNRSGSENLLPKVPGWYWQGCFQYALSVLLRGVARSVQSKDSLTEELRENVLEDNSTRIIKRLFHLKEALQGNPEQQELLIRAMGNKLGDACILSSKKKRGSARAEEFWDKVLVKAKSPEDLENLLGQYLLGCDENGNELVLKSTSASREVAYETAANLVEHYGIDARSKIDRTSRSRIQDSFYNGLGAGQYGPGSAAGAPVLHKMWSGMLSMASKAADKAGFEETAHALKIRSKTLWSRAKANQAALQRAAALKEHDLRPGGCLSQGQHQYRAIKTRPGRYHGSTRVLAKMSEFFRFIGHHGILASDTNLGRFYSKVIERGVKLFGFDRTSVLLGHSSGAILGLATIGLTLALTSFGLDQAAWFGMKALEAGGITIGGGGYKIGFVSLSFTCGVFMAISAILDLAAQASIRIMGYRDAAPELMNSSLRTMTL